MDDVMETPIPGYYVLVEVPPWTETKYFALWLTKACEATDLLREVRKDAAFWKTVDRLECVYGYDFDFGALRMITSLFKHPSSVIVQADDESEGEQFAVMAQIGFFELTGKRYQMVIPQSLDICALKNALKRLAATEDSDFYLHPEDLIVTTDFREAKAWQRRLESMPNSSRQADRLLLLGHDDYFCKELSRSAGSFLPK